MKKIHLPDDDNDPNDIVTRIKPTKTIDTVSSPVIDKVS